MKINLGSGNSPQEGFVNIDINPSCNPDLVADISKSLPFQDGSVDYVRAYDVLEHIPIGKTIGVIDEIWRVLKPNGTFEHFTPSTDGRGAFQDPTHASFWNINSWFYFTGSAWGKAYGIKSRFVVESLNDILTNNSLRIIHTHGVMRKEQP